SLFGTQPKCNPRGQMATNAECQCAVRVDSEELHGGGVAAVTVDSLGVRLHPGCQLAHAPEFFAVPRLFATRILLNNVATSFVIILDRVSCAEENHVLEHKEVFAVLRIACERDFVGGFFEIVTKASLDVTIEHGLAATDIGFCQS